jgi:tetratricopeptide (TPR) repeat protein
MSINDVSKQEGKKNQTALLSAAYDQAVTVSYRTVDGTGKAGEDYVAKTGTLTFAPGETTKTITIEIKGDNKNKGELWITDFGLARLEGRSSITMTGDLLGTLRYMSPEQMLGTRAVVDHRADIYALGVTLYELLTLEAPFPGRDRHELLRNIGTHEPIRPRSFNRAIPKELEIVILKALEKGPEDRYSTAQELADDLRRFLENKPIRATRPSLAQYAAKWSRRNPSVVWSAVAILAVAVVALGISTALLTSQHRQLVDQRNQTTREQRRAEEEAAAADAINRFLTEELLWQAHPDSSPVADQLTVLEALDRAALRVDASFPVDKPLLKAAVHQVIGRAYEGLGDFAKCITHFQSAMELRKNLVADDEPKSLQLKTRLGKVLTEQNQWQQAEQILRECLDSGQEKWGIQSCATIDAITALLELAHARDDDKLVEETRRLRVSCNLKT